MSPMTRDYLRAYRLALTQCAPNVFRILGCVDALNEKMSLGLTHHDVNWVCNLHHLKGQGYYLNSRYPEVRLIQCLPESNKGLNKDFLIFSREWHDGPPTRQERDNQVGFWVFRTFMFTSPFFFFSDKRFFFIPDDFTDKHVVVPNFGLVN